MAITNNPNLVLSLLALFFLSFLSLSGGAYEGTPFYKVPSASLLQLHHKELLEFGFYRKTCPKAEQIIRETMSELYSDDPSTAPQLLRLFFHDCFIGGCDASILLDESGNSADNRTEKMARPNQSLKGFGKIALIKSRLEHECPGIVSCADTLALAAKESVELVGGPSIPLLTGRGDGDRSHFTWASDLPFPNDNISTILLKFKLQGFTIRESVSLLASHNIGGIGCEFIVDRLANFSGSGQPDESLNPTFLEVLRNSCTNSSTRLSSGTSFDTHYFERLLNGTGYLFSDQQLLANHETARIVHRYAKSDGRAMRKDFEDAMAKLSLLGIANYQGSVRQNCARLPPAFGGTNSTLMPH